MMLAATMAGVGFGSAGAHIPHSCAYPIAFRFTYDAMPERHHEVAELLAGAPIRDPGPDTLPNLVRELMQDVRAPRGLAELGYSEDDVPDLVAGALKQERLLAVAPKSVTEEDLRHIVTASMTNW